MRATEVTAISPSRLPIVFTHINWCQPTILQRSLTTQANMFLPVSRTFCSFTVCLENGSGMKPMLWNQATVPLTCWMTLCKLLLPTVPRFPHLWCWDHNTPYVCWEKLHSPVWLVGEKCDICLEQLTEEAWNLAVTESPLCNRPSVASFAYVISGDLLLFKTVLISQITDWVKSKCTPPRLIGYRLQANILLWQETMVSVWLLIVN